MLVNQPTHILNTCQIDEWNVAIRDERELAFKHCIGICFASVVSCHYIYSVCLCSCGLDTYTRKWFHHFLAMSKKNSNRQPKSGHFWVCKKLDEKRTKFSNVERIGEHSCIFLGTWISFLLGMSKLWRKFYPLYQFKIYSKIALKCV